MSLFDDMFDKVSNPKTEISTALQDLVAQDDRAEEVINSAAQANQQSSLKRRLTSFSNGKRKSQDAYLSLHRQIVSESGDKTIVGEEPVTIGDRELREHRFYILSANYKNSEKFTVRSTFGDGPEIAYSFGESPRMWRFTGALRRGPAPESVEYPSNNWWQALSAMYQNRLRATILMKNNEFIRLRLGKLSIRGYITQFTTRQSEKRDDASARLQFSMYVRSYRFADGYKYRSSSEKLAADNPVFEETEIDPARQDPTEVEGADLEDPTLPAEDNPSIVDPATLEEANNTSIDTIVQNAGMEPLQLPVRPEAVKTEPADLEPLNPYTPSVGNILGPPPVPDEDLPTDEIL